MTGRRAATLRLAWRLVQRSRARSALIAVLVALPVLAGTFVAVTVRTAELSPAQAAGRFLGTADAIAVVTPWPTLDPSVSHVGYAGGYASEPGMSSSATGRDRGTKAVDLPALLPPGARAVPFGWNRYLAATAGGRRAQVTAVLADLADPITRGTYEIRGGRAPHAGEVAVTTHLADRLRLHVGSALDVSGSSTVVSAVIRDPSDLSAEDVVGPAQSLGGLATFPSPDADQDLTWLISYPGPSPDLHAELARHGVIYETRSQWEHPSATVRQSLHVNSQERAILGSIIGFGLAEIVLLAGTAFAVGVRRQVRELGLVRAVGGDERDVRRVIVSQALLLGVVGALTGVALGFLAVALGRAELEGIADRSFGPLDAKAIEIVGVALVGVVAALLAAVVPARTSASLSVLDMLRTRFRVDIGAVRLPRWTWGALVLGPTLVIAAAVAWHHSTGGLGAASSASIGAVVGSVTAASTHDGRWTALVSLGAAVTLAGIARSCPRLLTGLGRRAGRLPLSLRLAVRDAARHRHRTAPAVAAVATVVAGTVIVLLVASSQDVRDRRSYQPEQPLNTVSVGVSIQPTMAELATVTSNAANRLGGGPATVIGFATPPDAHVNDRVGLAQPHCGGVGTTCDIGPIGIATAGFGATVDPPDAARVDAALAAGRAVALDPMIVHAGHVRIADVQFRHHRPRSTIVTLPAIAVHGANPGVFPTLFVSAATAVSHGWDLEPREGLFRPAQLPTQSHADHVAASLGSGAGISVERGYRTRVGVVLLALLGASALAVLMGTSIAVALAMAESRPDMATFAAVGASPGRRRILAMGQAATVGWLGTLLGLLLGLLVGVALLQGSATYPFTLPLRWLALLVGAAPLLAVAVAGAVTRSRVPLTRRMA